MSMGTSADPMAIMSLSQQDMVQRKLEMDRLRSHLNNGQSKEEKLREACEGFESVFVQKIWEQMRKNVQHDSYLHSRDEQMYQGMYDAEFAKKMTEAGGIGLADMLYEQLSQRLGESSRTTSTQNNPRLPIIPAGSLPSQIPQNLNGLNAEAQPGIAMPQPQGMALNRQQFRPLYETAVPQDDFAAPQVNETQAPAQEQPVQPVAAPRPVEEDFEGLSQHMLAEEFNAAEPATGAPVARPESEVKLGADEKNILQTALQENINEAKRADLAELLKSYSGMPAQGREPS